MVYVSYSQKDKSIVQQICRNLAKKGIQLFVDYEQLAGGVYAQELTRRIEEADAIILFYSKNSENSTWVKREVEFSISRKKTVIPVLLTDPDPNGWLHYNLGNVNWISKDEDNLKDLTENILKALYTVHEKDRKASSTTGYGERGILPNIRPTSSSPKGSNSFRSKSIGCGCLMIFILLITIVYFVFSRLLSPPMPLPSLDPSPNQDSLIVISKKDELKMEVDNQLRIMFFEISESPRCAGNGSISPSHFKKIESLLGVDSIPFSKDSINTREGLLKAFDEYQRNVYVILEKRLAEMEEKEATIHSKDTDATSSSWSNEGEIETTTSKQPNTWLYHIFAFLAGGGIMLLLLRIRKSKGKNVKLTSDIASIVSIDGGSQKEIKSREVYSTHLDKGEYLIDFEDKSNHERHKTFNHTVDSYESKLIFADFESLSSAEGKSIKCFIAGSKTLQTERDALRAVTCVMYNKWASKNFRILSYTFEDFERAAVIGGHQKQYNDFIANEADWALFIIDGRIGGITIEEYRIAMDSYKKNGRPKILAFAKIGSDDSEDITAIKAEINKEHQYWTDYADINSLKLLFESTLNWDLIDIFQK